MGQAAKPKKRVIINYNKLTAELKSKLRIKYPTGYTDSMIRIEKGPGDFFYAVMLETDETNYLVKIDVKVDDHLEDDDDDDGDYYDDEIKGADEIPDDLNDEDEEDI